MTPATMSPQREENDSQLCRDWDWVFLLSLSLRDWLHEFRADKRSDDKSALNGAELARFAEAVLGCDIPDSRGIPWCIRVPDVADVDAALYIAHAVTDLREAALIPAAVQPA